jgi:hypothetical protein
MLPPNPACESESVGEPVAICGLCIGRPRGCRLAADGTHWCGSQRDPIPGYCIVSRVGELTGYRQRRPDEPITPEQRRRIENWLADHAGRCAADRELRAQCANSVEAGLAAIPTARLTELLANAVASTPVVQEHGRDLDDLASAIAEVKYATAH